MAQNQEMGHEGEMLARKFLEKEGYEFLTCNFRCHLGEIDLIMKDNEELVFVEVKTRGQSYFGTPGDAVTKRKKYHIYHVAEYFLMKYHLENVFCRLDVVEILKNKNSYVVHHIKNSVLDRPKFRERGEEKEDEEW